MSSIAAHRPHDPANPDVDNMSYEQLLALGDSAGAVSRGYTKSEIDENLPTRKHQGAKISCLICMESIQKGVSMVKRLRCGHLYDADCITEWLQKEKRCPLCQQEPI